MSLSKRSFAGRYQAWTGGMVKVLFLAHLALSGSCNTFAETQQCTRQAAEQDCGRGTTCSPGGYCERGGPIVVGALLPKTGAGRFALLAQSVETAFRFSEAVFSGKLGPGYPHAVLGRGLHFLVQDDRGLAEGMDVRTKDLLSNNPRMVLGPLTSAQALEASKWTLASKTLHIGLLVGARTLGESQPVDPRQRFLLQLSPTISNGSILALMDYVTTDGNRAAGAPSASTCKRLGVIANEDTTGSDYRSSIESLAARNCLPLVVSKGVPVTKQGSSFYDELVAPFYQPNTPESQVECLIYVTSPDVVGSVQLAFERRKGTPSKLRHQLGTTLVRVENLFGATKSAIQGNEILSFGMYGADLDPAPERQQSGALLALYNHYLEQTGVASVTELPDRFGSSFDSAALSALAIELAGEDATPERLRNALIDVATNEQGDETFGPSNINEALDRAKERRAAFASGSPSGINYDGASADIEFGDYGFTGMPMYVWRVDGAAGNYKFVPVKRYTPKDTVRVEGGKSCP
jgi:hypothetical protein